MQYAFHCKLVESNNMLPPKSFQIFLSGGAAVGAGVLDFPGKAHFEFYMLLI